MLSDTKVKNLRPADTRKRHADSGGLYVDVQPNGKKTWLFRYTEKGKRHWHSLGEYPVVGLREARDLRDRARRQLFDGETPGTQTEEDAGTLKFHDVALEWYEKNAMKWSEKTRNITIRRLEMHVFPFIGDSGMSELKPKDLLSVARRTEGMGAVETTRRVIQICGQVFRYAIACGHCEYDPTQPIQGALEPVRPGHFASLTRPADVAQLLRSIDAYPHAVVRYAMQFSALAFLRPGEVRHLEWAEIEGGEIRIPEKKMKMDRPHIVPLAAQTLDLLQKTRQLTGHGRYVFPSNRAPKGDRPMSENTVLVALRSMGYSKEQMTAHGFRHMASTLLNENGFNRDWIERQLAHVEGNGVRAAYNYAEYLPERRKMMQWFADYLDELKGDLKG
jgi:integrase